MESSTSQGYPHTKVSEVIAKYPPRFEHPGRYFVLFEYQQPYEWFDIWEFNKPSNGEENSFITNAVAYYDALKSALKRAGYRYHTIAAKFRHCRLIVLERDGSTDQFKGKAWSFTDADRKEGALKEEGVEWWYDDTSSFEAGTSTTHTYAQIQDKAEKLQRANTYDVLEFNCETFCERLSLAVRDQLNDPILSFLRVRRDLLRRKKFTNRTQEFYERYILSGEFDLGWGENEGNDFKLE